MQRTGGLRLELHTALFPPGHPFAAETADVWLSRARTVTWAGRSVQVLPPAWHVVHASTHWAWSHEGTVGTWQFLHDVQRLAAGWSPDGTEWEMVVRNAELIGASIPVGWGLWTARQLVELPVSELMVDRLRTHGRMMDGMVQRQWVLAALFSAAGSPSVRWSRFWWRRAMRGLGDGGGQWPWAAGRGRTQVPSAVTSPVPTGHAESPTVRTLLRRWHRHLTRVLGR